MFRWNPQNHVFQGCERFNQHEMLMDHPDAELHRLGGGRNINFLPMEIDFSPILLLETIEDVHQGCLAGTILSQHAVNLSLTNVEVDVVVGKNARELLGDSHHTQCELFVLCHQSHLLRDSPPPHREAGIVLNERGGYVKTTVRCLPRISTLPVVRARELWPCPITSRSTPHPHRRPRR